MTTAATASVPLFHPQTAIKTVLPIHTTSRLSTRFHLAPPRRRELQQGLITTLLPKCLGSDGGGAYENDGTVYPRPAEIPWSKELANYVTLIGTVGSAVQIKYLNDGRAIAWTSIAVKKSRTETSWVNISFWNELANIAFQHVVKGQQIHVSGRLVCDTVEGEQDKKQVFYKVVVQQLNFITNSSPPVSLYNSNSNSTPKWESVTNYASNQSSSVENKKSVEELWQAYFASPSEWWDNRQNKKSSKHPDFKHKDTGEALWVEGIRTPPWVKSQLDILDARMRAVRENESNYGSLSGLYNEGFTNF